MKRLSVTLLACLAIYLIGAQAQQPTPDPAYVPGELIVKFRAGASQSRRLSALAARQARIIRSFDALDIHHIGLPKGITVEDAIAALQANPDVEIAQPNYVWHAVATGTANDPNLVNGNLWGMLKIQAPNVWSSYSTGDSGVVIVDIDTGVNYNHPDLAANIWTNPGEIPGNGIDDDGDGYVDDVHGINVLTGTGDPMDDNGHGTHTAGTLSAVGNNGIGVVGVNWNAKVLACKFLSAAGSGSDAGAIACFNYTVLLKQRGVNIRVTSNSWGGPRGSFLDGSLKNAIDAAGNAGILNAFAAGNNGTNNDLTPFDPASMPSASIISVAASDGSDNKASFSNYGAATVHIAAPGVSILSTYGGDYAYLSGTSMATPHVAGAAALLAAINPALTVANLKSTLMGNVDALPQWSGLSASAGRLNVYKAATAIVPNTPPTVTLTGPANGATFLPSATINLTATAADSDGTVSSVAFYAGSTLLGSTTSATNQFGMTWSGLSSGTFVLKAVATDNRGAQTTSNVATITVNNPPSVTLTSPLNGSTFTAPANVTLTASASDTDGTIASVRFVANGSTIATVTTSPYVLSWSLVPVGAYSIVAVATDNLGATTTSAAVPITVSAGTSGRVNVALASNGATALASSTNLAANFAPGAAINGDRTGALWGAGGGWLDGTPGTQPDWLEVDFAGTQTINEIDVFGIQDNYAAPSAPIASMTFTYFGLTDFEVQYWTGSAWLDVPGGAVIGNSLVWRQFLFSNITTSRIRVFVTKTPDSSSRIAEVEAYTAVGGSSGNQAPTVAITNPLSGAAFNTAATVTVTATASDSDGTVASVGFYANGTPIGTATSSPYTIAWTAGTSGSYSLTAVATDNLGATTTSAAVPITVSAGTSGRVNVALASNGATALASSTNLTANFAPGAAINADRTGALWGAGGGWLDGTPGTQPDWLEVDFAGTQTINEIDVFGIQDNYAAPSAPIASMTFTYFGLTDFEVQYWTGSAWLDVPGGAVIGNSLVWRQFLFSNITTSRIRVFVTKTPDSSSRIAEVEAYTAVGGSSGNQAPTVAITNPLSGAAFNTAATVTVTATASDSDGTVASVGFYANGTPIGTATSSPYTIAWTAGTSGTYSLTAVATDNLGAATTSAAVPITVSAGRVNIALASSGSTALASSTNLTANFAPGSAINGDRTGALWGAGGGWLDGTPGTQPDWLEVDFAGTQTINEIDVFGIQDNYAAPSAPTASMTFTYFGVTDFEVQYWTGSAWLDVPGGAVIGNNLVWRQFSFSPIATSRIRVSITKTPDGYSRLAEIEAYTIGTSPSSASPEAAMTNANPESTSAAHVVSSKPAAIESTTSPPNALPRKEAADALDRLRAVNNGAIGFPRLE